MPKTRYATRADFAGALPWKPMSDNSFNGAYVGRGTLPGDRLSVKSLDAITVNAGELQNGTLHSGNREGAHVSIGDAVRGIQLYDSNTQLMFAVSWIDGSFRLGLPGEPGVYMLNGDVHIDGDVLVDGSVTASKITTSGALGRVLLEDDRIMTGTGDWDAGTFNGFAATTSVVGGYKDGAPIWTVDNATGAIVLTESATPTENYTRLDGSGVVLSNSWTDTWGGSAEQSIVFRTIDGGTNYDMGMAFMGSEYVVLKPLNTATSAPVMRLTDYNAGNYVELGIKRIFFQDFDNGYYLHLGARTFYGLDLCVSDEVFMGVIPFAGAPAIVGIDRDTLNLYGASIRWKIGTRSFPIRPTWGADEMGLWPNPESGVMELWTGAEWKTFATA